MLIRSESKDGMVDTNKITAFDAYGAVCVAGEHRVLMAAPNMCRSNRNDVDGVSPLDVILVAIAQYGDSPNTRVLEMSELLKYWDKQCKGISKNKFVEKVKELPDNLFTVYGNTKDGIT